MDKLPSSQIGQHFILFVMGFDSKKGVLFYLILCSDFMSELNNENLRQKEWIELVMFSFIILSVSPPYFPLLFTNQKSNHFIP